MKEQICVGKSPEGVSKDQEYEIELFDEKFLEAFTNLESDDIDPKLLSIAETDPIYPFARDEILSILKHYISEYSTSSSGLSDGVSANALTFFRSFLMGHFVNVASLQPTVVVVNGSRYRLWAYEESWDGEKAVLRRLANEGSGVFAIPANGFWRSNLLTMHGIVDEKYQYFHPEIGLMMN